MRKTPMWRKYLRFWGADPPADVDTEISFHFEELVKHYVARGMTADRARSEASRRFGSIARVRAECVTIDEGSVRAARRRDAADALWQDVLDACRGLTRNPGFTVGAALILAVGIGFNTTIYSFNKALFFPSLPVGDAPHLVRISAQNMARGAFAAPLSEGEFADVTAGNRSFLDVAAYVIRPATLTGGTQAERIAVMWATTNLFSLLQVQPSLGRDFRSDEAAGDGSPVAILSHRAWENRFAGDRMVVGRDIHLDGRPHTVIGVMPDGFWFELRDIEVWLPHPGLRADGARDARTLTTVARLDPHISPQAAQADMQALGERLAQDHPGTNSGWNILVTGLLRLGPGEETFFALVTTLLGLLLAAACAHVANLLLARGVERRGEIAIRAALGAGRGRILRQLFAESVALAVAGGVCSLLVTFPILRQIRAVLGSRTPLLENLSLDGMALGITAGLIVVASVLFGLAPALRLSTVTAGDAMKQPPGGPITGRRRRPLASLMIGLETAVATLTVIVSVLFVRASSNVLAIPLGFDTKGVLTFRIEPPDYKYPLPEAASRAMTEIHARLRELPSIGAVGAAVRLPLNFGPGLPTEAVTIDGRQDRPQEQSPWAVTAVVTPGYFEALGIPVLQGRSFDDGDAASSAPVALVSRSVQRAYWPDQAAVGRRLRLGGADATGPWLTVIGVVDDVRPFDPSSPQVRQLYLPLAQNPVRALTYFVATGADPASRFQDVRLAVRETDPELPVLDLGTLTSAIDSALSGPQLAARSISANAVIALLLALTGVYSVVTFASSRRRREIAIRVALGGRRSAVVTMLLRQALAPTFAGIVIGLALAAIATRAIAVLLYGVNPLDPLTYALTAASLTAAAAAASCVPAIRATRVNAALALRAE